ncbi:MAG: nuclear transport factor 2 family protein [Alphaproteobacteria bacterium]
MSQAAAKLHNRAGDQAIEIVDRCCAAFNAHDVEGILSDFADDAVWLLSIGPTPEGRRLVGKAAIGEVLRSRFRDIPDMAWKVHRHFASGNVVCSEWTVTGTPKNGAPIDWLGIDIWELDGGKIVKKDTYWKQVVKPA